MYRLPTHIRDHIILGVSSGGGGGGTVTGTGTTGVFPVWNGAGTGLVDSELAQGPTSGFKATIDTSAMTGNQTLFINDASVAAFENNIVTGGSLTDNSLAVWSGSASLGQQTGGPLFTVDFTRRQIYIGEPGSTSFGMEPGVKFFAATNTATITLDGTGASGLMTMAAPGSGGRWLMSGNTSTYVFTVSGATGMKADKYNRVTVTEPASTATITIGDGASFLLTDTRVFDVRKSFIFDSNVSPLTTQNTHLFPTTNSTLARTDALQTFTGLNIFTDGVNLGTAGLLTSNVADAASAVALKYKPQNAFTSSLTRYLHSFEDSVGNVQLTNKSDGTWEFGGSGTQGGYVNVGATITAASFGINFIPTINTSGSAVGTTGWTGASGALFAPKDHASATYDTFIGGIFFPQSIVARTHARILSGLFQMPTLPAGTITYGDMYGWHIEKMPIPAGATVRTVNNMYGGYVTNLLQSTTKPATTNLYGLYVEEQKNAATINNGIFLANGTAGYKAIAIRDQNAWIGSAAAAELTIGGTNCRIITTNFGAFNVAAIARPTNAIAAAAFVTNTSLIANDTATWGGYTAGQVVQALINLGFLT